MGLISPPKWPSVNPFSHPLGSKIGRKPMVNPSKWVNLKSNFLKFHHRNQAISGIEKARKMAYFRAFLALLSCRLSLAELRSATSGFEAVLLLLAKDLEEAYGFPVLVVRPKAMFTTCYANVPEEIEEEFLSKYGDFVRNLYDNTVTVNRIFTGMRNRRSLLV